MTTTSAPLANGVARAGPDFDVERGDTILLNAGLFGQAGFLGGAGQCCGSTTAGQGFPGSGGWGGLSYAVFDAAADGAVATLSSNVLQGGTGGTGNGERAESGATNF